MEPVLGGRDDCARDWAAEQDFHAAMEPVLGGRDDAPPCPARGSSAAGRNGARPWRTGRRPQQLSQPTSPAWAAMEPVLGGRDDVRPGRRSGAVTGAAMEPVLGGRDDVPADRRGFADGDAAMEPVLGGRDDLHSSPPHPARMRCRNGARPWRTGRRPGHVHQVVPGLPAAMEPVLGGRDDPSPRARR